VFRPRPYPESRAPRLSGRPVRMGGYLVVRRDALYRLARAGSRQRPGVRIAARSVRSLGLEHGCASTDCPRTHAEPPYAD